MIEFKDLPVEIQQHMLNEQVRQGNERDAEIFEIDASTGAFGGGFTWNKSVDGYKFWEEIIEYGNLAVFYEKYPIN